MKNSLKSIRLQGRDEIHCTVSKDSCAHAVDSKEVVSGRADMINLQEDEWNSEPEPVLSYMGDNYREDDGTYTASQHNHSEVPDCWDDEELPIEATKPALTKATSTTRMLSRLQHGYKPTACCSKPTMLLSRSFVCNTSLEKQIESLLHNHPKCKPSFIDVTIERHPVGKKDYNIQYRITFYKHNCSKGLHVGNSMNNAYYWLFYAYQGTVPFTSLTSLMKENFAMEITKYMTVEERTRSHIDTLLIDVNKKTIAKIKKYREIVKMLNIHCEPVRQKHVRQKYAPQSVIDTCPYKYLCVTRDPKNHRRKVEGVNVFINSPYSNKYDICWYNGRNHSYICFKFVAYIDDGEDQDDPHAYQLDKSLIMTQTTKAALMPSDTVLVYDRR